jgi:hypothetical protein
LLIADLAIYLFAIGVLLNRTADNLDDSLQNVKTIAEQAEPAPPAATPAAPPRGLGYLDA